MTTTPESMESMEPRPKKRMGWSSPIVRFSIIGLLIVLALAVIVPVVLMSSSRYLATIEEYEPHQKTLEESKSHSELSCRECHQDSRNALVQAAAMTADFYITLGGDGEPRYAVPRRPANDACLGCHREAWAYNGARTAKVPHPAHLRVADETRECVKCHKWIGHKEKYQDEHKTMKFSGVCARFGCHVGYKTDDTCSSCHHELLDKPQEWKPRIHYEVVPVIGVPSCLESCHEVDECRTCHTTGKSKLKSLTASDRSRIEAEHASKDFLRTHAEYGLQENARCMTCHVSEGECMACHSERPASHDPVDTWLTAHAKRFSASELAGERWKKGKRCLTCHELDWCVECHDQFKETG